ncbi:MAG: type IV pilus biogenesis/stability protein PilW [Burkholderiales bacterium]
MKILFTWVLAAALCGCISPSTGPTKREDAAQDLTNRAHAHMELGMSYYENGKYQFAIEELNEALKARSDYVPAHSGLALVYMELKEDKKAEAAFKKALRYEPGNSSARNNFGQFLCSRGRTEEGLRQLLEAVKNPLYQTPDTAYQNAGVCARRIGDNARAEEYFRQAVMRNPRHAQALLNLSDLNYLKKNYAQAKVYADQLLQFTQAPGPELLWLSTRIARKLGDGDGVIQHANQLRRRYPDAPETRALLDGRFE